MLDRESILSADDLPTEDVDMSEWWGGVVRVRALTGTERDHFEAACMAARRGDQLDIKGLKARLLVLTLCDSDGEPLFGPDDGNVLNAKSAAAIDRLFQVAQRLSGLAPEDVDELVGNSVGDRNADSGTG